MLRKKILTILGLLTLSIIFLNSIKNLQFNNDKWLLNENPYQKTINYINSEFEPGTKLTIVVHHDKKFFNETTINEFSKLSEELKNTTPHFISIQSPLEAIEIFTENYENETILHTISYREALEQNLIDSIKEFENHFKNSDYYEKLLSRSEKYSVIQLKIEKDNDYTDANKKALVVEHVEKVLKKYNLKYSLAEDVYLTNKMNERSFYNSIILIPSILCLLIIILWILLKQFTKVLVILIPTLLAFGYTFFIIDLLNHPLTIVNLSLPILILVIAIADSIHILARWNHLTIKSKHRKMTTQALKQTWVPCLITSISTAIGFGSFYLSDLIPLHQFGIQSILSISGSFIIIIGSTYLLLNAFEDSLTLEYKKEKKTLLILDKVYSWITYYKKQILLMSLLLVSISCFYLKDFYTETNFLDVFFKKNSPVQENSRLIDNNLNGSGGIDILLYSKEENYFKSIHVFNKVKELEALYLNIPLVTTKQSYINPIKMIHRHFSDDKNTYPDTSEALEQELLLLEFSRNAEKSDILSPYANFDYTHSRIVLQTPNLSSAKIKSLMKEIKNIDYEHNETIVEISGPNVLFHIFSEYVLKTQIQTILFSFSLIGIIFICLFGLKHGSLAMIPNLFPVITGLGIMCFTKTPFDFSTVLVASISFGLAVDDTAHFLYHYKHNKAHKQAIRYSFKTIFKPLAITSLLLIVGFSLFVLSDLVILIKFGLFSSLVIALALASNIIIFPLLLQYISPKET